MLVIIILILIVGVRLPLSIEQMSETNEWDPHHHYKMTGPAFIFPAGQSCSVLLVADKDVQARLAMVGWQVMVI